MVVTVIKKLCNGLCLAIAFSSFPAASMAQQSDLSQLSIEELADLKVTSASKKTEKLSQAPAAIFVLRQEDLRRGGFTTLPDALRSVPGLYVVQTTPDSWQVSARGFSDTNNNKMLVLVDGRSVYTPLFGGVHWDVLDLPLEDIERIEVIRGPGGTLWGANAVNGVINIVTKSSKQTYGLMLSTSTDINQGYTTTVQTGGGIGRNLSYRLFGKASYSEPYVSRLGSSPGSSANQSRIGMRADLRASPKDSVSLEVEAYDGRFHGPVLFVSDSLANIVKGSYVLADWKHTLSDRSNTDLLAYCDWFTRQGNSAEMRNSCGLDFQHSYDFNRKHSLIWGGSFLSTGDDLDQDSIPLVPSRRRLNLVTGFAQYELEIVPERFRIIAGSKIERNYFSGFEYQPQMRAVWTPSKTQSVWGSVSRAVRTPVRSDHDVQFLVPVGNSGGLPVFLHYIGNPNLQSEHLRAYELGYRFHAASAVSFDLALYYNDYNNLIVQAPPVTQVLPTAIFLNALTINGPKAQTHGAELSAKWRPVAHWLLSAGVTELRGSANAAEANSHHLFNLQSRLDLSQKIEFDSALYHYSALPLQENPLNLQFPPRGNPNLNRVDIGVAWHINQQCTLAAWGRNLQSDNHVESLDSIVAGVADEVPRSVVLKFLWRSRSESSSSADSADAADSEETGRRGRRQPGVAAPNASSRR
jgi:iron complex outermembrane receptor protein